MTHPMTDEMIDEIQMSFGGPCLTCYDDMRAAYDVGYAKALEDVQDVITCIQRKDSPTEPITLEELEAMRPQQQEDN